MPRQNKNPGKCSMCDKECTDRCEQLTGPCCHKSLTFEDCVSGDYNRTIREEAGLYDKGLLRVFK